MYGHAGEKPLSVFNFSHLYDNDFCLSFTDSSPKKENFDGLLSNINPILCVWKICGEEIFSRYYGQAFE